MNAPRLPHVAGSVRVYSCTAAGVVAGVATSPFVLWKLAVLIGWVVLAGLLLGWVWYEVSGCDAEHTRARATAVDPTRISSAMVMVVAAVMSFVAIALCLEEARERTGATAVALTVLSVLAVVQSWLLVHSMFILRYAHEYYSEPEGGIDFPGDDPPDYRDFAYFAFTIGVAFAVSDTPVVGHKIRRTVYRQALISYLLGAVVVGLAINVMAGFVR